LLYGLRRFSIGFYLVCSSNVQPSVIEGPLWPKFDGKKAWKIIILCGGVRPVGGGGGIEKNRNKRFVFVCIWPNRIFRKIGWRKSTTDFRIQVKRRNSSKYLCRGRANVEMVADLVL